MGRDVGASAWTAVPSGAQHHAWISPSGDGAASGSATPFGSTIAHGFLTLSLLSVMAYEVVPAIEGRVMGVNYGFDRVRFVTPVRAGSRVRGRFTLRELTMRSASEIQMRTGVAVEIEGVDRPALVADWIILNVLSDGTAVRSSGEPA
jgi:acyl dehydratase